MKRRVFLKSVVSIAVAGTATTLARGEMTALPKENPQPLEKVEPISESTVRAYYTDGTSGLLMGQVHRVTSPTTFEPELRCFLKSTKAIKSLELVATGELIHNVVLVH